MNSVTVGDSPYKMTIRVWQIGSRGLVATVLGGERPHVGGSALAVPRVKSSGEGLTADVSQLCVPGHKDVFMAAEVAKALAVGTGQVASVTAGAHVEEAQIDDISLLMQNALEATRIWIEDHAERKLGMALMP